MGEDLPVDFADGEVVRFGRGFLGRGGLSATSMTWSM
jgi:hypothetical protein